MVKPKSAAELNGTGYEWEYAKKIDNRTTGQKILSFIYNSETHEFFGRTAKSWGGLLLFYAIFYSILALLFAICMKVLLTSLPEDFPKWQLHESIIGTSPGLGFRPMANDSDAAAIIWYNKNTKETWMKSMKEFRDKYYTTKLNSTLARDCQYNNGNTVLPKGDFCKVSLDSYGSCAPDMGYGFGSGHPCIFLKLNRIYGWVPEYYNDTATLPQEIPAHTREKIVDFIKNKREPNYIWVSCDGQSPHDRENQGELQYIPQPGFPYYFYPYLNTKDYMSPLVAVQFVKPQPGVLINMECRAWAKNIQYKANAQVREGSVHFELQVDDF